VSLPEIRKLYSTASYTVGFVAVVDS